METDEMGEAAVGSSTVTGEKIFFLFPLCTFVLAHALRR